MSINGIASIPTATFDAATPTSTASAQSFAAPNFGSYTPGGNLSLQASGINLLPFGVSAPTFGNAQNFIDPAFIIQPGQQLFVSDRNQNQFDVSALIISVS